MSQTVIFNEAVKLTPEERAAYLERVCGSDRALRNEVESLLDAHEAPDSFLRESPERTTAYEPIAEGPGTVIGPYKLLEQIGEGGFGVVFAAEQAQPVRRRVALKVLKPGMDTRQVVARFEAERQALAIMDHPNIAHVFDGGATETGRPYFVMEWVKGVPITEYCELNHLPTRQRLELFVQVCQAVQHAHQKGIIHRDLKPSNVLVSRHDTTPVVKVIDFGVAKALGQSLTDKTLFTGVAQMLGTPLYMSPEQAGMSDLDVDTRSDVYSLGVLLYELLTGTTPFDKSRFQGAGYEEIRRIIREEEPPKPSTRLTTVAQASTTASANRASEVRKLSRLLRGELDWIVMKALEKDRTRRYETAAAFAADVEHYLADERILACPPSAMYRFRKFARRNKRAMVMASVFGLALLVAVGSLGWVLRDRASGRVRTTAEVNQILERAETFYADNKLPESVAEVQKARGVLEAGRGDEGLDHRVRQWITDLETAETLESIRLASFDLEDRSQIYVDYARIFREYGIDVETLPIEEAATRVAASRIRFDLEIALSHWGSVLRLDTVRQDPARWQRLFAIARSSNRDPWRQRLETAADARDLRTLRELANAADPSRLRTRTLAYLGDSLRLSGDIEAAIVFLRRAQRHHSGDYLINSHLARCLEMQNPPQLDEALAFRRAALAVRPQSALAHLTLAGTLRMRERLDEAVDELHTAIRLRPEWAVAHNDLALTLQRQKKLDEAIRSARTALRLDPSSARYHGTLGSILHDQDQFEEAAEHLRRAIQINPSYVWAHATLGSARRRLKQFDLAITHLHKALEIDPNYAWAHNSLGLVYADQKKPYEAIDEFQKTLDLDPSFEASYVNLGDELRVLKRYEEAIAWCRNAIEVDPGYASPHVIIGLCLRDQKNVDGAIAEYRRAIEKDAKHIRAHLLLGNALKSQGKLEEAEFHYRKTIEIDSKYFEGYYALGNLRRAQKKLDEAIVWFEKTLTIDPSYAFAFYGVGICRFDQKRYEAAAEGYRNAIRVKPDYALAHNGLGNALKHLNKPDEAIEQYKSSIAFDPNYAHAYYNLGILLVDRKDWVEALKRFEQAIAIDPDVADFHYDRGNSLWRLNRAEEAIASCKTAIALDPKHAKAHNVIAICLKKQNKLEEAIGWYKKAIALDPTEAYFHHNLGIAFAAHNKLEDAIAEYLEAIRLDKQDFENHFNLGNAYLKQKKWDAAAASYREAIRLKKDYVPAHNNLGNALAGQNNLDAAAESYREAIRLKADHKSAYIGLSQVLRRKGDLDGVIALFEAFTRVKKDDVEGHFYLAQALLDRGRREDALAAYRAADRIRPNDSYTRNGMGWVLAVMGRTDEAIRVLEEAIHLKGDNIQPHLNLAWLFTLGPDSRRFDSKRAMVHLARAEELIGKKPVTRMLMGMSQYRAGNWKEAIASLEESLSLEKGGAGIHSFGLAMANKQLGKDAEARMWYGKAVEWAEKNPADPFGEHRRLRAEAADLLGMIAPPPRRK